jgi:NAD-specific glutamate dehydrogenase
MSAKANIVIDQGTTFTTEINLTDENGFPMNLVDYVANSQMRKWYTSANPSAVFTTEIVDGTITLSLSANETANIAAGRYVYDIELTTGNTITRIVEGIVTVTPEVTR